MCRSCLQLQTCILVGMFHQEFDLEFAQMAFMAGKLLFDLCLIFGQASGTTKAALETSGSAVQGL